MLFVLNSFIRHLINSHWLYQEFCDTFGSIFGEQLIESMDNNDIYSWTFEITECTLYFAIGITATFVANYGKHDDSYNLYWLYWHFRMWEIVALWTQTHIWYLTLVKDIYRSSLMIKQFKKDHLGI